MDAFISGQAAQAVLVGNNKVYLYRLDDDMPTGIEIHETDIPHVFENCTDVRRVSAATGAVLKQELELDWSKDRALHMLIILLDPTEDQQNREAASECLNEFLGNPVVERFVAYFFYSSPLRNKAQFEVAIEVGRASSHHRVAAFLNALAEHQPRIRKRWEAWEGLPLQLFGSPAVKDHLRKVMVNEGAFWQFVTQTTQNAALLALLVHPHIRGIKGVRQILQAWAAPFHEKVHNVSFEGWKEASQYDEVESRTPTVSRSGTSGHQTYVNVLKQMEAVKQALNIGKRRKAWQFTRELVASQRTSSEPQHIAKSLCALAQHAKKLGDEFLHLHFSLWAVKEYALDSWSYHQVGDAYKAMGSYERAMEAFQKCGVYGDECMSLCGRGEVFKDSGAFEEAIVVFEECIERFPGLPGPRNGLAATLLTYGRLESALQEYDKIATEFPYERVTLNGRATVLSEMGRLTDAFDAITGVIRTLGPDPVSLCTKAGILKAQNKLNDAAGMYGDVVTTDPMNRYAMNGLATTYKLQGRFEDALATYERMAEQFRYEPFGLVGRAGVLKIAGRLDEAEDAYLEVVRRFKRNQYARNGLASVLATKGKYEEALTLLPDYPPSSQADWVAQHIRGMTWLKMGKLDVARDLFRQGSDTTPWFTERQFFQTALALTLIKEREFRQASTMLRDARDVAPELLPAVTLLRLHVGGELNEAEAARGQYDQLRRRWPGFYADVRETLFERYLEEPRRYMAGTDWAIAEYECNVLLMAA